MSDGYCDDGTNTAECNYDGGDCCGSNVNIQFCAESLCYEELNCAAPLELKGNDETNNAGCNFDGGDCCGACQSYIYQVLQTIQMKLILLCVWAEPAVLGIAKLL